ncbi:MAG: tannase/feruloyl esterase family alpha/beta hydrolase [Acidobacteriota bacterium]|nr:tannase/feruloyl esterase family alpha/beta hydrolase [Acidobacteriota bacterium]
MEAQHYPDDYGVIVGGAPANNRTGVHVSILWNFVSTERAPEDRIPMATLRSLGAAVMAACDGLDGMIGDPQRCSLDPASVQYFGSNILTGQSLTLSHGWTME